MRISASAIDDFGDFTLDKNELHPQLTFAQDSGWFSIQHEVQQSLKDKDEAVLKFVLSNGEKGGYGGRLQISDGRQQYDTGAISIDQCPCNKAAFQIRACFIKAPPLKKTLSAAKDVSTNNQPILLKGVTFHNCTMYPENKGPNCSIGSTDPECVKVSSAIPLAVRRTPACAEPK